MKRLNLKLTSVIVTIAVGVLLPVVLSTAVGIVALVFAEDARSIIMGVLALSFTVTAAGSALIAVVLTSRKATLARRQADFVANVSHEFRTPLSAIRLYTQTLQSGKLANDPRQTEACLATILRETEWLNVMVDRAIAWRASSRDSLRLNLKRAPVSQAVYAAVDRFRTMVRPDAVLLTACADSNRMVNHDPEALEGVILNLLTNAYKYTENDKQIRVRVRDDEAQIAIDVSDNGIGLTPHEKQRVFHPFYRADTRGEHESSGVGLGLSIAKRLIERQGGSIGIESTPGTGSTFTIHLPVATT